MTKILKDVSDWFQAEAEASTELMFLFVCFCIYSFILKVRVIEERKRHKKEGLFHLVVHSPDSSTCLCWNRLKPGVRSSIWVLSHGLWRLKHLGCLLNQIGNAAGRLKQLPTWNASIVVANFTLYATTIALVLILCYTVHDICYNTSTWRKKYTPMHMILKMTMLFPLKLCALFFFFFFISLFFYFFFFSLSSPFLLPINLLSHLLPFPLLFPSLPLSNSEVGKMKIIQLKPWNDK